MNDTIRLLLQGTGLLILIFWVIRRQLHSLFVKEDDPKVQYTKNVMFAGAVIVTLASSTSFIRLLYIAIQGHTTVFLDDLVYWTNGTWALLAGVVGLLLYQNKREL